jgi:hypothetical protein
MRHWETRRLLDFMRRALLCRLGVHNGAGEYCAAGCGASLRRDVWETWRITLRDGETVDVRAVNATHALSQVVYGADATGEFQNGRYHSAARPRVRVHPRNIRSAETMRGDG